MKIFYIRYLIIGKVSNVTYNNTKITSFKITAAITPKKNISYDYREKCDTNLWFRTHEIKYVMEFECEISSVELIFDFHMIISVSFTIQIQKNELEMNVFFLFWNNFKFRTIV